MLTGGGGYTRDDIREAAAVRFMGLALRPFLCHADARRDPLDVRARKLVITTCLCDKKLRESLRRGGGVSSETQHVKVNIASECTYMPLPMLRLPRLRDRVEHATALDAGKRGNQP